MVPKYVSNFQWYAFSRTLVTAAARNDTSLLDKALSGEFGEVSQDDLNEALLKASCLGYKVSI